MTSINKNLQLTTSPTHPRLMEDPPPHARLTSTRVSSKSSSAWVSSERAGSLDLASIGRAWNLMVLDQAWRAKCKTKPRAPSSSPSMKEKAKHAVGLSARRAICFNACGDKSTVGYNNSPS